MDPETLKNVEKQRLALEENIAQLRKSLRHWQNLEVDYEGLREEIDLLPPDASSEDCLRVAREAGATVVDEKDLADLISDNSSKRRSPNQISGLLVKRIEYVSRNADTIRKQITSEEKKLNALLLVEDPDTRDDAGLPLTEITEVLDADGNVISSKVERPAGGAEGLAEVLAKAGVEGMKAEGPKANEVIESSSTKATIASSSGPSTTTPQPADINDSDDGSYDSDDTTSDQPLRTVPTGQNPIPVQVRDTAEEARMRREMLEYGLNEVGAIVAELDMQEGESDVSYDEDDDNLEMDSDDDDEEEDASEDEFGRTKTPAVSEKYKQKMQDLEKRLGLTDLKNLGPSPDLPSNVQEALDRPPAAEAARKAAIARAEAANTNAGNQGAAKKKSKKSVAFSEALDIADDGPSKHNAEPSQENKVNPVGETVLERSAEQDDIDTAPPPPAPAPKKLASRFKSSRTSSKEHSPHAPARTTIDNTPDLPPPSERPLVAGQILERPTSRTAAAPDPDAIDNEMHRREIAVEYHKLRNRRIHAQGGFVRDRFDGNDWNENEDDEDDEIMGRNMIVDEETGEVKRVSRFKAARLRG